MRNEKESQKQPLSWSLDPDRDGIPGLSKPTTYGVSAVAVAAILTLGFLMSEGTITFEQLQKFLTLLISIGVGGGALGFLGGASAQKKAITKALKKQ